MIFSAFSCKSAIMLYFDISGSSSKVIHNILFGQVMRGEYYFLVEMLAKEVG